MAKVDHGFEEFRSDLIAHLSARFRLAPDVVAAHLNEWLLDGGPPRLDRQAELMQVPPRRTRR